MGILTGKTAVITGSTRGLGLAIARAYAREGAAVVISSRSAEAVDRAVTRLRAEARRVTGLPCDVGDMEQVQTLAAHAEETFGGFDIWVNNAGVAAPYGPTAHIPSEGFLRVYQTNILGVYHGSMVAIRRFLAQGHGKLINVLGRGARRPVPMQNAYAASKAWVRSFTLALAREYRESGVGIYAFSPGLMDTDLLRRVEAVAGYEGRLQPLKTVMRLWANPPEVPARKAVWLASDATDGRTGLEVRILGPAGMARGVVRDLLRRLLRRPAPPFDLEITTIPPAIPEIDRPG
ncbi:MAG: SDR family oxidoreductase [Chloroflexi bacterium]|nr:SDR family oxidoreductase [Chloroflexota bacterium]